MFFLCYGRICECDKTFNVQTADFRYKLYVSAENERCDKRKKYRFAFLTSAHRLRCHHLYHPRNGLLRMPDDEEQWETILSLFYG